MTLEFHPYANLFPLVEGEEFKMDQAELAQILRPAERENIVFELGRMRPALALLAQALAQHDEWTIRGARIREARKAKGMNGKELAVMANVAPNIVSMCEHAKHSKSGGPAAGRPAYAKLEAALGIAMT